MDKNEKEILVKEKMERIINYFEENKLNDKQDSIIEEIKETLVKILQLEAENINTIGKKEKLNFEFIDNEKIGDAANFIYEKNQNNDITPRIEINIFRICTKLNDNNKEVRILKCKKVFMAMIHEMRHYQQYLMTQTNQSNKNALIFARDMILRNKERFYKNNYYVYAMEKDARYIECTRYLEIMKTLDKKIANLRDIEKGIFENCKYETSKTSMDRDKLAIQLLDNIICEKKITEGLLKYPILQKEYNLDGSRKTVIELVKNMQVEEQMLNGDKDLLKDSQEMYYELIYEQLKRSSTEEIEEAIAKIGDVKLNKITKEISKYFDKKKDRKIEASLKMAKAQEMENQEEGFILPSNNKTGIIEVEENNQKVQLSFNEFMDTIDDNLLNKKYVIPLLNQNIEIDAEKFIRTQFLKFIPKKGTLTLKDGEEISAKQFIEQHILTIDELRVDYPPELILKDMLKSESPWKNQKETQEKIEKSYNEKQEVINTINEQILQRNKRQTDNKMYADNENER